MKKPILWLLALALVSNSILYGQIIEEAVLSTNVKNMEPVNQVTEFNQGDRAYCWMKVSQATPGSILRVKWYCDDILKYTAKITLKYASQRTYTYKTLHTEGNWRAEITGKDNTVLETLHCVAGTGLVYDDNTTMNDNMIPTEEYYKPPDKDIYLITNCFTKTYLFLDKNGNTIATADEVNGFYTGFAKVVNFTKDGKTIKEGLINRHCELISKKEYDQCSEFSHSMAKVKINGLWGMIDTTGKEIIKPKYKNILGLRNGSYAIITKEGKWGVMDKTTKIVVEPQQYVIEDYKSGIIITRKSSRTGYIYGIVNKKGKLVTDMVYDRIYHLGDGFTIAGIKNSENHTYNVHLLNNNGNIIKEFKNARSYNGLDGFGYVNVNENESVVFNTKGKITHKDGFINNSSDFREGFACLQTPKGWIFINEEGKMVFNRYFKSVHSFSEGLAVACEDVEKCGYIDKTGKYVIQPKYKATWGFANGKARVRIDGKDVFIDKTGNYVYSLEYEDVSTCTDGNLLVLKNNQYRMVNEKGEEVFKKRYQDISCFNNDIAIIKVNGKYGTIHRDGRYVIKPKYNAMSNFDGGISEVGDLCADQTYDYTCYWYYIDMAGNIFWKPENKVYEEASVILPPDYNAKRNYPVLVTYPHTGGNGYWLLGGLGREKQEYEKAFSEFLEALYPDAKVRKENSFILLQPGGFGSPADHSGDGFARCIERYEKHVKNTLREYSKKYNIDTTSVYAAGYSLGGDLSWAMNMRNPEMYRGAVISGSRCSYPPRGSMKILKGRNAKFYMAAGEYEASVRVKGIKYAMSLLKNSNLEYQFYEIPQGGHVALPGEKFLEALRYIMGE